MSMAIRNAHGGIEEYLRERFLVSDTKDFEMLSDLQGTVFPVFF